MAKPWQKGAQQAALGALAVSGAIVGFWAAFAPRSFYDDFPGAGRTWVSVDGPYNEHLVRDVGSLTLALTAVTVLALIRPTIGLVRAAAVAWLVDGALHFVYHLRHLDPLPTSDQVAEVVVLAIALILPLLLLVTALPDRTEATGAAARGGPSPLA